jgi:hypothetical protein
MMKGWYFNIIPVGTCNSHLRLFLVYVLLKWKLHAEDYILEKILPHNGNAVMLSYNGSTRVFY